MSWVPFATAPLKLHCSTKNLTRHFFHQAIRKAWLPSLIASLMRVMDHLSLLLATAPQRFARRVDPDLVHAALKGTDLQGLIASGGTALQLPENVAAAPFEIGKQPGHDLLPLSLKGVYVGASPAQNPFSPLLLSVQSAEFCSWIGCAPRSLDASHRARVHGKDADGGRRGV